MRMPKNPIKGSPVHLQRVLAEMLAALEYLADRYKGSESPDLKIIQDAIAKARELDR